MATARTATTSTRAAARATAMATARTTTTTTRAAARHTATTGADNDIVLVYACKACTLHRQLVRRLRRLYSIMHANMSHEMSVCEFGYYASRS